MIIAVADDWQREVEGGDRFGFGANWVKYLRHIDENRIQKAEASLKCCYESVTLRGLRFLDIGSGSGLFSLAARRLGAEVISFDYDPHSVGCTAELRRRYFPEDDQWKVMQGSVLDKAFLAKLGSFDIVYSWGVLHHTGAMWEAIDNAASMVAPGGRLHIALYNDQGRASRRWRRLKKIYVRTPGALKWVVLMAAFARLWAPTVMRDTLHGRPLRTWRNYPAAGTGRAMDPWRDVVDWVGGYPFEVATPDEVIEFCRQKGFELVNIETCGGGHGCNEFLFMHHVSGG